jgi:hypothetical protein
MSAQSEIPFHAGGKADYAAATDETRLAGKDGRLRN